MRTDRTARQRAFFVGFAIVIGVAIAVVAGRPAAAGPPWQVAPAGPCAQAAELQAACPGGTCGGWLPARSRFEPTDVAAGPSGGGVVEPPVPDLFPGPGSCADPSTPCGRPAPPQVARDAGQPGVVESPVGPGTLPGGLPGQP